MSKAERTTEQMCDACWMHNDPECGYECRNLQRKCTNNDLIGRGYELAEKDLALTIQDLELLHTFLYAVKNNKHGCFTFTRLSDEQYIEVLKRFTEAKK